MRREPRVSYRIVKYVFLFITQFVFIHNQYNDWLYILLSLFAPPAPPAPTNQHTSTTHTLTPYDHTHTHTHLGCGFVLFGLVLFCLL